MCDGSEVVLEITNWRETFETHESRKVKTLSWVALPTSFDSRGYQTLLDDFGDEAPMLYGAWCALLCVASRCHTRGVLADSRRNPLKVSWIARQTGFPLALYERLIAWASSPSVQWLSSASPLDDTVTNPAETAKTSSLADSAALMPDSRQKTGPTGQNITRQDITQHHITSPNLTPPPAAVPEQPDGPMDGLTKLEILKMDFQRLLSDPVFIDEVRNLGNKMLIARDRAKIPPEALSHEYIWHLCWVSNHFDISTATKFYEKLCRREVQKPKPYADAAMRSLCNAHASLMWEQVQKIVPPPPSVSKVDPPKPPHLRETPEPITEETAA